MAKLALINNETEKPTHQWVGDSVGVFRDDHQFSETELVKFDILTVGGSVEDVQARLDQIKPREEGCYYWQEDVKYHWLRPVKKEITAIVHSNPMQIVVPNHNYTTGMIVKIVMAVDLGDIVGVTYYQPIIHPVTVLDQNSFTVPIDSTQMNPFALGTVSDYGEAIKVYQVEGSNKWYKLVNDFKFMISFADLTQQEKDFLATLDINHPSVDSFIRKIVKDLTADPANGVEVKELRNSEP